MRPTALIARESGASLSKGRCLFDEVIIRKFVSEIAAYPATRTVAGATKGTGQAAR